MLLVAKTIHTCNCALKFSVYFRYRIVQQGLALITSILITFSMKNLFIILFCTTFLYLTAFSQLTTVQWREDLQFLKTTVHNKYPNLFHNVTAQQFDDAVASLDKRIPELKDYEVAAELAKIVAMFHIGHTQLSLMPMHQHVEGGKATLAGFHFIPGQLHLFSDGLYIKATDKQYEKAVGGKVLKIGNMETAKAMEAIRPYVAYENEQGFKSLMPFSLFIVEVLKTAKIIDQLDNVPIVYEKNGKTETVVFERIDRISRQNNPTGLALPDGWIDANQANKALWAHEPKEFRYMEYLKDSKALYVRHSVTLNDGDKTIEKFFKNALDFIDSNDVEKLILDVRMNGGGNNYLNKPIITSIIQARKINQKGKFYCIIGRRTFSACQNLVNELEKYTEVTFVGEPTSENVNFYGDTKQEVLPNCKLTAFLSWMWWQNLDARDKRLWTSPNIAADMSFVDYVTNNDPSMNAILDTKGTFSLKEKLTELAQKDEAAEALKFAKEFIKDPKYRYYSDRFEDEINEQGYTLMVQNKLKEAYTLLDINVQLYPESANVYDSKAECLWKMGKKEEAIKTYQIAIAKDPNGQTGDNARRQIERIKAN